MVTDVLGDALARLKNGIQRRSKEILVMKSNLVLDVLKVLKKEEYISDFKETDDGRFITVYPVYEENGEPEASHYDKVSKPGQRVYTRSKDLKPVVNGRGIAVISTSEGVMTGAMAKSRSLGGEYLCNIW